MDALALIESHATDILARCSLLSEELDGLLGGRKEAGSLLGGRMLDGDAQGSVAMRCSIDGDAVVCSGAYVA